MPTLPWRFQADLTPENTDPDVTVFVGDTITNDVTGEKKVHQDTANPEIVRLSELSTYIATAMTSGVTRTEKPDEQGRFNKEDEDDGEEDREPVRMTPKPDPKPAPKPAPKPMQRPATRPGPTTGGQRR
jgi:hypothetical protein